MLRIGSHVSMSGDEMYLGSVKEALSYQANAFMIYTGAPQNTRRKNLSDMKIDEAVAFMKENKLDFDNVVVHAPYIINLGNPDPEKRAFAVSFLTEEIKRTAAMHAKQIVLHPGSAVGGDRKLAIIWIAEGIKEVIKNTRALDVKIALETMAGKGNEIGKTFEELKEIIDLVNEPTRVSVCFDTCHTHDAGYAVKEQFDEVIKEFDRIIGKSLISVFHVNDSKNPLGASKDRHENFGFGYLGFDALIKVIYHPDFNHIPKILETPYVEGNPPYKEEIEMIKTLTFDPTMVEKLKQKNG
ncbi:deoxyribonuclease IV [Peloplasma aerotolerans]|uniref:Probable endonuclease 4 n=1 Tax=Peloplasma aerotolerans TaxID=3044389 RepID=A0AAW6U3H1_9MOLU|nr:deoxyribonuclease IV [Mariniplasma sp. M4Ah]MDI6452513.1 deoxyribonuclease IV [Mariniplasma sp. M4Ah]